MSVTRNNRTANQQLVDEDGNESDPEESQLIEERLKNLLRSTTGKNAVKTRNIFNDFQGDAPKLRNSVITRALQKVVCSTPMPTEKHGDFFSSENSFNISPIDPIMEELDNKDVDKDDGKLSEKDVVFNKEPRVLLKRTPVTTIIILNSSSETENHIPDEVKNQSEIDTEVKKTPYNTRRQSKKHDSKQRILTVSQIQESSNTPNHRNNKKPALDPTEKPTKIPVLRSRSKSKEKLENNSSNPSIGVKSKFNETVNKSKVSTPIRSPPKSPPKRPPRRKKGLCKSTRETKSNTNNTVVDVHVLDRSEQPPNLNETFTSHSRILTQPENVSILKQASQTSCLPNQVMNKTSQENKSNCALEPTTPKVEETLQHSKRTVNSVHPESVSKGIIAGNKSLHSTTLLNKTGCHKRVAIADANTSPLGNSPYLLGYNRSAYINNSKVEKLNRLLTQMSQKFVDPGATPVENNPTNRVDQCVGTKDKNVTSASLKSPSRRTPCNRMTREVQTSLRRSCRITPKKSFAERIITRTVIEQQTQTSSVGSGIKSYRRSKSKDKLTKGYISDTSRNTSTTDQSEVLKEIERENLLFQSLTEGVFPPSFSSSDDEIVTSINEANRPWRLDDDIIQLPRRSSYHLNFLRSAREIETERKSALFGNNYLSDSDSELEEKYLERKKKTNEKRLLAYTRKNKLQVHTKSSQEKDLCGKAQSEEPLTDEERSSSTSIDIPALEVEELAIVGNEAQPLNTLVNDINNRNLESTDTETTLTTKNVDAHNKSCQGNVSVEDRVNLLRCSLQNIEAPVVNSRNYNKESAFLKKDNAVNNERNSKNLEDGTEYDEILAVPLEDDALDNETLTNQRITRLPRQANNSDSSNVQIQHIEKNQVSSKKTLASTVNEKSKEVEEKCLEKRGKNDNRQLAYTTKEKLQANRSIQEKDSLAAKINSKRASERNSEEGIEDNEILVTPSKDKNVLDIDREEVFTNHGITRLSKGLALQTVNNCELTDVPSQRHDKTPMSNLRKTSTVNKKKSSSTSEFKVPKSRGRVSKKQIVPESDGDILAIPLKDSDVTDTENEEIVTTNHKISRSSKSVALQVDNNSELSDVQNQNQRNDKTPVSNRKTSTVNKRKSNSTSLPVSQMKEPEFKVPKRKGQKPQKQVVDESDRIEESEILAIPLKDSDVPSTDEEIFTNYKITRSSKGLAQQTVNDSVVINVQNDKTPISNKNTSTINKRKSHSTPSPVKQTNEPEFKVPKRRGRKPKKQIAPESDDCVSSTTVDSTESLGVRRSGRERKPTQRRVLGFVATHSEKDLQYYNGTCEVSSNIKTDITMNRSSKPRTKKQNTTTKKSGTSTKEKDKSAAKNTKRSGKNKKAELKEQEEPETVQNAPIVDSEYNQNELNTTQQSASNHLSKSTERKKRNNSIISSTTNVTVNNETQSEIPKKKNRKTNENKQPETRREPSKSNITSKRLSFNNHISYNEIFADGDRENGNVINSAEIPYDEVRNGDEFTCPSSEPPDYNITEEHSKPTDKDSGRSTMLKSTTFVDSYSKFSKPLTGRIGKKYKKNGEDIGNKISKVLSRSVNRSSEFELVDGGRSNGTMCSSQQFDRSERRSSLMQSKFSEGDHINLLCNSEIVSMKYVDQAVNYKVVRDNLMVTDALKIGDGVIGYLKLLPGSQKPLHIARKYNLAYFVIEGEGLIQVHNKTSKVGKLSRFGIPLGVEYSINNLSKEEPLVLAFIKMPPNSDSQSVKTTV